MSPATHTEPLNFTTEGDIQLAGCLELPEGGAESFAVFAHCFTGGKDLKASVRISQELAERGIGVLRFDFTGLGESGGEFAATDFDSNVADLVAAAEAVEQECGPAHLLVGHSLGGAAALKAAVSLPQVRAVATIGAPATTEHLRETLLDLAPELSTAERATVKLAGRNFTIGRELVEDLAQERLLEVVSELERALLIFHSPIDQIVGIEHAAKLYQAARHPKSFVALDGADHLLLEDPQDAEFVAAVLAAWAPRYVRELGEVDSGSPNL